MPRFSRQNGSPRGGSGGGPNSASALFVPTRAHDIWAHPADVTSVADTEVKHETIDAEEEETGHAQAEHDEDDDQEVSGDEDDDEVGSDGAQFVSGPTLPPSNVFAMNVVELVGTYSPSDCYLEPRTSLIACA